MTVRGHIRNGTIVLDESTPLPEGAEVEVHILSNGGEKPTSEGASLLERLAPVVGKATTLPSDAASQHDHYLYGLAKK